MTDFQYVILIDMEMVDASLIFAPYTYLDFIIFPQQRAGRDIINPSSGTQGKTRRPSAFRPAFSNSSRGFHILAEVDRKSPVLTTDPRRPTMQYE